MRSTRSQALRLWHLLLVFRRTAPLSERLASNMWQHAIRSTVSRDLSNLDLTLTKTKKPSKKPFAANRAGCVDTFVTPSCPSASFRMRLCKRDLPA